MPELWKLYQGKRGPLPNSEGVPEGPQRKNHVVGRDALRVRSPTSFFHPSIVVGSAN